MAEIICPHCGNPIYDDEALLCLYCGRSLRRKIGIMGKIKNFSPQLILTLLIAVVLLSFVLLMVF
ncbi:MAG: zinc-ribbon domain-containing protein [Candidatus Omnitrophica bacterium]|nr:zinc-ribbon domain-containing protein [Candidatus Omnitrophota bacterium]